jgi:hypothetical protein
MTRNTDNLIHALSDNLEPVRPIRRPWMRTALWLAILFPYVAVLLMVMAPRHNLSTRIWDTRFQIELAFAFATGVAAVLAAFASVIPGPRRRLWVWPLIPLAGWLATIGEGCVKAGPAGITWDHDLTCFPFIVVFGTAPAIVLWLMLRKGAPMTPRLTVALGALGAAGLGNFCVRLGHPEDVSLMLLVWHVGGVFLVTVMSSFAGRTLLRWKSVGIPELKGKGSW